MLILAGVAIAAVVDGDGLFSKTRQAAETYENATRNEGDTIQSMINQIDEYLGNKNTGTGDGDGDDDNPPAEGATIGEIVDENKTFTGGKTGSYNDPIIPKGFAPINEGDATWGTNDGYQKGLVIEDESGNQFVWVPVDGTTVTFARQEWRNAANELLTWPANTLVGNDDATQYTEMVPEAITTSVNNNGGFYIGRFEAGQPVDGRPVSKQKANVYNSVNWTTAKTLAEAMYPVADETYGAISTLIYGVQWDTALKFIGAYGGDTGYATDSTGKGNYNGTSGADDIVSTTAPAECGAKEGFRQKNIYDMAGNVWEWTMEKYSTGYVYRGGNFNNFGSEHPASYRFYYEADPHGFRVALYIK